MTRGRTWPVMVATILLTIGLHYPAWSDPISPPDTASLNSMAKEVFQILAHEPDLKRADSIISSAYDIAFKQKLQIPILLMWANAEVTFRKKDFENAYKSATKVYKSFNKQFGPNSLAEFFIFYSKTCQSTGNFSLAIDILNKNLEFAKKTHLKQVMPQTYSRLYEVYLALKNSKEAINSLNLMLESAKKEGDLELAALAYFRLGSLWSESGKATPLASDFFEKSLKISLQLGDTLLIARNYAKRAWNYYLDKELDSAYSCYKSALSYCNSNKYPGIAANAYGNIGTIFRDLKKTDKAIAYWTKGIETAEKIRDWSTVAWIYDDMSKMAADAQDYKKAYSLQLAYKQYSDSASNQTYTEGIEQARVKFESDKKQKDLEMLSLKLKSQRLLLYGFGGILALLIVISLLLLRQYKQNAKRKISEMDQKILEITQANLRQQMNPHFIFNTLNSIQYYMYKHDKLATNNYLTKFSSLMRKILENSQHTAVPIRNEIEALELYLELEALRFKNKFDYEIHIDEEIDPILYKIPTMLIQPYVENAICHGLMYRKEKGKVVISLTLCQDYISCVIEDNGVGREASREINMNKERHNSLGTQITESRLKLANSLYGTSLKTTYTDLRDEAGNGAGTRVEIHIPILT